MNPKKKELSYKQTGVQVHDLKSSGEFQARPDLERSSHGKQEQLRMLLRDFDLSGECFLPDIARAAIELCGADSAGVSIEKIDAQGDPVFHWAAVSGQWAGFQDVLVPRAQMPCRVSLETMQPQHIRVSSESFEGLGMVADPITDGISVPWSTDGIRGTVWIAAHQRSAAFNLTDSRIMQSLADLTVAIVRKNPELEKLPQLATADMIAGRESRAKRDVPVAPRLPDKAYLFKLRAPQPSVQLFVASAVEIHDDQLALLNGRGHLVALIVLDIIEGWYEVNDQSRLPGFWAAGNTGRANMC